MPVTLLTVTQVLAVLVPVLLPSQSAALACLMPSYGAYRKNLPVICIVGGLDTTDYGTNRILHHTIGCLVLAWKSDVSRLFLAVRLFFCCFVECL